MIPEFRDWWEKTGEKMYQPDAGLPQIIELCQVAYLAGKISEASNTFERVADARFRGSSQGYHEPSPANCRRDSECILKHAEQKNSDTVETKIGTN